MNARLTAVVCCVVLVVALLLLWLRLKPEIAKVDRQAVVALNTGLGQALAEETVKAVHDRSSVVIVTMDLPVQLKSRSNYQWNGFASELQQHSAIHIIATESVQLDQESGRQSWPLGAFKEIWERHTDAAAFVFFVDLPGWATVAELSSKAGGPKIIAIDNMGPLTKLHYGGYFTSGILAALIGAPTQPVPPAQPKTPREWFDQHYQVYTPQNFDTLPE